MKTSKITRSVREWVEKSLECEIVPKWRQERHEMAKHLKEVFRRTRVEIVLDVGANHGQYYDFLRTEVGYDGPVHSFEPTRQLCEHLKLRAAGERGWYVHPCALGDSEGEISLNVMRDDQFTSILAPKDSGLKDYNFKNSVKEVQRVSMKRLDAFIAEEPLLRDCNHIYLKIDTQGFDLQVFAGLGFRKTQVVALQSEVSLLPLYEGMPDYKTSIAAYNAQGYEISGLFPIAHDQFLRVVEFDCVAVNPRQVLPVGGASAPAVPS